MEALAAEAHVRYTGATIDPTPELPSLPYGSIGPQFESLLTTAINRCDRDWPAKWASRPDTQYLVVNCARITRNTYNSLRWLLADDPKRAERKLEYALSAVPLVRSLADTVFLLVYLFSDVDAHSALYFRGGWREMKEDFDRHSSRYGADPEWADWLAEFAAGLEGARALSHVTTQEAKNPSTLGYWPTPARMRHDKALPDATRAFMSHLDSWFYKSFSSYSHLSLSGLVMRATALRETQDDEDERVRRWRLDKQRSDAVGMSILLGVCVVTEISAACSFGLSGRLGYVWGVINGYFGMAKELHAERYEQLLALPGT